MIAYGSAGGPDTMQKMPVPPAGTLFQAVANFEAQFDGLLRFGVLADPEESRYYAFFVERHESGTLQIQIFPQTYPPHLDQTDINALAYFVGDLLQRADNTVRRGK